MRFRVLKPFSWGGIDYEPGGIIDIDENHPRLSGMVKGKYIVYDAGLPSPDDVPGKDAKSAKRKS